MQFPEILNLLKIAIGLFNYYRKFVSWFAILYWPLTNLKTKEFKNASTKEYRRDKHAQKTVLTNIVSEKKLQKCKLVFKKFKTRLYNVSILAFSNFDWLFILYIDGYK